MRDFRIDCLLANFDIFLGVLGLCKRSIISQALCSVPFSCHFPSHLCDVDFEAKFSRLGTSHQRAPVSNTHKIVFKRFLHGACLWAHPLFCSILGKKGSNFSHCLSVKPSNFPAIYFLSFLSDSLTD